MAQNDEHARGLVAALPEALRYNTSTVDHDESSGYITSMVPQGARVLDVGCGTGSIARLLMERKDATVVGLEPHAERAKAAAEAGVQVAGEMLDEAVLPELGQFDVVLFADVLEHMMDPFHARILAKSLLRPNGSVVVSLPNVAHWSVRLKLLFGRFDYQPSGIMDATHLRWFTRKTLNQLFERAGYRVVENQASSGLWMSVYQRPPWNWIPRKLRRPLLRHAVRWFPTLFGCQNIVRAQLPN